ncbi:hypothetical protein HMPREF0389_01153 [Filifactor alocis ATCC 35896]|uniref:Uncharacterized protein n=1 Tax=Filifactor alocis (strain ATCC 35896 / CCUG 47790 / D40 B5) TaxID=546269 RepID=D6GSR6_FILAD|nr:hypothetical protein [Filifactor alocis]EFE27901.1 hypothetical protein HMPREF0389_01153 [Filifactor alocis ATCC 35896]
MTHISWRFPPLSGGTRQGYTNNDIEVFKGQELFDNLTREICQNSLDAHLETTDAPVKVVFEFRQINMAQYDVFSEYGECLKGCRNYWGDEMDAKLSRFVTGAETTLQQETIPVLIASDYHTKGLSGSHSGKLSSSWEALTGSDGISVKSDENSAGSYGIGKNAPFACSSLSMVFYNTLAEDNESAFIGVARLATLLNSDGKPTQRVGKYQNNDEENEIWKPIFDTDTNAFRDCFTRTERGTDVIIVGFTQSKDWVKNITNAVLKNFFVAISEGRLIVELKDSTEHHMINADTLSRLFFDLSNNQEMIATTQLYKAFTTPDCKEFLEVLEPDDVEVYIKSDSSYKRTIANFRATGMLVGTYFKRIFQHYAAVVIVRGQKLGELLKDTEPPRHNKWDYKQIESSDKEKRTLAKRSIQEIDTFVLNLLKDQFEIVTEDTIDAAGIGEYIPDDIDGLGAHSEGEDILKVKIKIGKIITNRTQRGTATQSAVQEEGAEQEGDVRNHTHNPNPMPPKPRPPKPVTPDPDDPNPQPGATPGNGIKTVNTPNLTAQRAFPISCSQGLYKIVIKPAETYENLYVECFAVGEDSRSDILEMESFTYNGKRIKIAGGKAGPVKVEVDTTAMFFVKFVKKEKMKLSVHLTEVVKK